MGGLVGNPAGVAAPGVSLDELLLRAALLAGHGAGAADLAARYASLCVPAQGRSCVEAGAPLQISIEAPGPPDLRVGLRLGDVDEEVLTGAIPRSAASQFTEFVRRLPPPEHDSFGHWLFTNSREQSLLVDLRDPSPAAALRRARHALAAEQRERLDALLAPMATARLWAVELVHTTEGQRESIRAYWLLGRHEPAEPLVERLHPGAWGQVVEALSLLVRRPGRSGRWLLSTLLEDDGRLRIGNSGWTLAPEDDNKHRAVGSIMQRFGGPRDYAEAMWSLCRGSADPAWRVGRTCEIEPREQAPGIRLHLTPQVHQATTARINNAGELDSSIAPTAAEPSKAYRVTR